MVGKSLSFCVSSMCRGEVKYSDVERIDAGTKCPTFEIYDQMLVEDYMPNYWRDFPELAHQVAIDLWNDGKIYQCRLEGLEAPNIANGKIWR